MNKYKQILESWKVPEGKSTEQAWSEIESKLNSTPKQEARVIPFNWKPLLSVAAAAAVVIIVVVMAWPKDDLIRKETATKELESFELPDHSIVTLNASSYIEYNEDWNSKRTLKLEGEAFFEVKKGSSFSVITDHGIVTVLGTSFDVFARNEKFKVSCTTGLVRISAGKSRLEITPGNAVELINGVLQASQLDVKSEDWRTGEFSYTDEPLSNVLEEIERQFGVSIKTIDIKGRRYSGRFNNKNLNETLELVCLPMNLSFEIKSDQEVELSQVEP